MSAHPTAHESVKQFWEGHLNNELYTDQPRDSDNYFSQIEETRYAHHYHLPQLFQKIAGRGTKGKRLLEIGCGIGIDTFQLARLGFAQIVAADLTESAIAVAQRRAQGNGLKNVQFIIDNAEYLSASDNSFDVVYSFGVIHHTPAIDRAVTEIYRVLKPGGTAYIMLYHSFSLVNWIHQLFHIPYESPKSLSDHCPVVYRFTKRQARALFGAFDSVSADSDYPFTYGMRRLSWMFPHSTQRFLGRFIGWHLMIEAHKEPNAQ